MLKYIDLRHVGPARSMRLDFASRLNLLTGDNSLGKTFALDIAWWALTRTWAGEPAWPHREEDARPRIEYRISAEPPHHAVTKSEYDFEAQEWEVPARHWPAPGIVLYARVDGSFSLWDPAKNYWKRVKSPRPTEQDRPAAYHFEPQQVWDGLKWKNEVVCNGLIRDWVTW